MHKWLNGKQKHIAVLGILLIYLFSANPLYVQLFLKNGKPVRDNIAVPSQAKDVVYKLADMQPVRVDGQDLYQIRGFAFRSAQPEAQNKISLVLSSKSHNLVYSTSTVAHPNMIESYPGYTKGMDRTEFSALLADNALPPGTYQVGILLEQNGGAQQWYVSTGGVIKRTANTINYVPAP